MHSVFYNCVKYKKYATQKSDNSCFSFDTIDFDHVFCFAVQIYCILIEFLIFLPASVFVIYYLLVCVCFTEHM